MPEAAAASLCILQLILFHKNGSGDACYDHLGDAVASVDGKWLLAEIKHYDLDLAPICPCRSNAILGSSHTDGQAFSA